DIPTKHMPIIRSHIEKMRYKVTSIFPLFGGPQITFLLPKDADRFMALGSINVPSKVLRHLAQVELLKEIPVERPFELVVAGARDYDELGSLVEKWARKTSPGTFIGMRSTDLNTDLVIFSMSTWAASLAILKSEASFRSTSPLLVYCGTTTTAL
ncbi:hypothetical protein C0993_010731, partial [Termitomyces sp. T159_Od127]